MTLLELPKLKSLRIVFPAVVSFSILAGMAKGDDPDPTGFGRAGTTSAVLRNLPNLDDLLSRALNNHPEIVAARAKFALAEAELRNKQIEVSQQIVSLRDELKKKQYKVELLKQQLETLRGSAQAGDLPADRKAIADDLSQEIIEAQAKADQAKKGLEALVDAPTAAATAQPPQEKAERQMPSGEIAARIRTLAEKSLSLDFNDAPLLEVANHLSDTVGIKFAVQVPALDQQGLSGDMPIAVHFKNIHLAAAIQALQDAYPNLEFVARDYGILITTKDSAEEHRYMPVLDYWK